MEINIREANFAVITAAEGCVTAIYDDTYMCVSVYISVRREIWPFIFSIVAPRYNNVATRGQ